MGKRVSKILWQQCDICVYEFYIDTVVDEGLDNNKHRSRIRMTNEHNRRLRIGARLKRRALADRENT